MTLEALMKRSFPSLPGTYSGDSTGSVCISVHSTYGPVSGRKVLVCPPPPRTKLVCVTGKMLPCQRQQVFGMQPSRSRADLSFFYSYVSLTAESFLGAGTTEERVGEVCVRRGRGFLSPYEVTSSVFVVPHLPL